MFLSLVVAAHFRKWLQLLLLEKLLKYLRKHQFQNIHLLLPTPQPTPTIVPTPTPQPTPTAVPTSTPQPTPTIVPTPTPIPTPLPNLEYNNFLTTSNLDEDVREYFTRDLFEIIGEERTNILANYVNDALDGKLSDYSNERIKDIRDILRRGHPGFIERSPLPEQFNEYFHNEIRNSRSRTFYGYDKENIIELLRFCSRRILNIYFQ